jgi:hypothetical protein
MQAPKPPGKLLYTFVESAASYFGLVLLTYDVSVVLAAVL